MNQQGLYHCVYLNVEAAQAAKEEVDKAIPGILQTLGMQAQRMVNDSFVAGQWEKQLERSKATFALYHLLDAWASQAPKPIVLLIDEIDTLLGNSLISVLRQLRAGYADRPEHFPSSVVLCGVRDVRDYRLRTDDRQPMVTGGSAFNIKATSLRLSNFDLSEIALLYQQHSQETGQIFEPLAVQQVWELTKGQPWLVNALAQEACFEMAAGRNPQQPITPALIVEAKERLIARRETHLNQLTDKLREARVRHVIEPLLTSENSPLVLPEDDVDYAKDLGLLDPLARPLQIANPIYREIIPRALTYITEETISRDPAGFIGPDQSLNLPKLLTAFQQFFREHSEWWVERFDYKEAGPQLLLQAFLQRIVNGGGRIEREYGLGRGRTDLLVIWPTPGRIQRAVIELKLLTKSLQRTEREGLAQTWEYMDKVGADEGHLVIFDRTAGKSWEERLFVRPEQFQNKTITVWGL